MTAAAVAFRSSETPEPICEAIKSLMKDKPATWNKGRAVGERLALSLEEAQAILAVLRSHHAHHDACLFAIGIDSMLRCSDLLQLRVGDVVIQTGQIRWRQKKTGRNVYPVLTSSTQQAFRTWVDVSGKTQSDFLFTRDKAVCGSATSPVYYRLLIKRWVRLIGLNPEQYSTHSLRRTKPSFLYHYGYSDLEHIARLLGHANTDSTSRYLGIQQRAAEAHALHGDIFSAESRHRSVGHPLLREFLKPEFLDCYADEIWARLRLKLADFIDENTKKGTK